MPQKDTAAFVSVQHNLEQNPDIRIMIPTNPPIAQQRHAATPLLKHSRSVLRCGSCREKRKRCSFAKDSPWPSKCTNCRDNNLRCSEPQFALRLKHTLSFNSLTQKSSKGQHSVPPKLPQLAARPTGQVLCAHKEPPLAGLPSHEHPTRLSANIKEATLLLSIHAIGILAIEEMRELAIDMMEPFLLDPGLECLEDSLPEMPHIIKEMTGVLEDINLEMLRLGARDESFSHAQSALNRTHYRKTITWGADCSTLDRIQDSIEFYRKNGHAGLAYVLQMKLLKEQVPTFDDEIESFFLCRHKFFEDVLQLSLSGHLRISPVSLNYHVYMPRALLRIPIIAKHVLEDKRMDCLGRSVYHMLYDAGLRVVWPQDHVNLADRLGRTPLYLACRASKETDVDELLKMGAQSGQYAINRLLPLDIAAMYGTQSMCYKIWWPAKTGDCPIQNYPDRSPLLWAVLSGKLSTVIFFHKRDDNVAAFRDRFGCSAVTLAACGGHVEVLKFLLTNAYELDHADNSGRTPFWYASRHSRLDIMELLKPHVNIVAPDKEGITPLAAAARYGCAKAVKFLLEVKQDLCIIDSGFSVQEDLDRSPLVQAALGGRAECLKLLLGHRSWYLCNSVIKRVLEVALRDNNMELQRLVHLRLNRNSMPASFQQNSFVKEHPVSTEQALSSTIPPQDYMNRCWDLYTNEWPPLVSTSQLSPQQ